MSAATIELTAPDISCGKCKTNIEGDLASEPGVEQVTVDVSTRHVRIAYDQDQTGPEQLRAKLGEIGYPAAP
jgi:copper chaperone CopZ